MEATQFDALLRLLADPLGRRRLSRLLLGLTVGGPLGLRGLAEADARRHKHKKKKRRKKRKQKTCAESEIRVGDECVCPAQCCRDAHCTAAKGGSCEANGFCQYPCIETGQPCGSVAGCCDANADCENGVCTICIASGDECIPTGPPCCSGGVCEQVTPETYECFV